MWSIKNADIEQDSLFLKYRITMIILRHERFS